MNIKTKLLLILFISSLIALAALSGIAVYRMHLLSESALTIEKNELLKDYDELIKGQVQSAVSLLAALEARAAVGEITRIEAKKLGADLIRQLRFQKEGYFGIDTVDGTNVVLLGSSSEGKNRINLQDNHGKYIIREIISQGRMPGGGYTDYWFPKAGGKDPLPKRGYSLEFKPWGWVVGTGNYIDDINASMAEHRSFAMQEYAENIRFFAISSLILILVFLGIGFKVFQLIKTDKMLIELAEEKLQKSEARFQKLLEKSPDAYMLYSNGIFIDCNNAAEVMLRGERLHIIGRTPDVLSPQYQPDGRLSSEASREKITEALRTGTNHFEWMHRRLDGSDFWTEVSLSVITLHEQTMLFGSWRDITERKQLEAEMQQLIEEQKIVLENAGVGISFVQNRQHKWSNTTFARIFGYKPEEMVNSKTSRFFQSQEEYDQFTEEAYPVLASGDTFSKSLQMHRSDGTLFHARFTGKAVNPEKLFDGSIWILSDETAQKVLEEKLQKSHDLLATLSRQIPGVIYQYQKFPDGHSCFPYASDAIIDVFGLRPDEVREDASRLFALIHPDDAGRFEASYTESVHTMQPRELQYRINLPGQGVRWRYSFSRPTKCDDGSILWHGFVNDITDQKNLEQELYQSNERFRQLAEIFPETIFEATPEGTVTYVNKHGLKQFRYPDADSINRVNIFSMVAPEYRTIVQERVKERMQGVNYDYLEYKAIRADGSTFDAIGMSVPVFNDGELAGIRGFVLDISRRKQMEDNLRKSETQISLLLQTTDQGIYGIDETGCFTFINRAGLQILGYQSDELVGSNSHSMIHQSYADGSPYLERDCPIYRANEIRTSIRESNEILWRKDGTFFNAEFSSYPILENDMYRGAVVTFTDITERKQAEDKLRKLSRAVEQSPVSIVITDLKGEIEFVNPIFTELTGYTSEAAIGQNPRILNSGQTPPETFVDLWSTITAGKTWEGEFHNKSKDGRMFWEHAVISPLLNENGFTTHYLAVKEDITEKKRILDQLVIAKKEADAANRAKSEFLANMSHEIRTPMNGVIGMTQLLELTDLTDDQATYVTTLRTSGNNLLSLINDILDLSKIESGMITLEHAEFNLAQSIKEVVTTQKQVVHQKGLSLVTNFSTDIPIVLVGDQLRVKQILLNLISNAVKFTRQGSITITAKLLEIQDKTALIHIAVMDTGIGIAPDALDKIFKPFVQEDGSITRKFGGTGLGLSISRSLAELMGGNITIESTPGVGSCFMVDLPFEVGKSTLVSQESSRISALRWDGPPLRILVVEDDPINILFATSLLKKLGLNAVPVVNGRECLAMLEKEEFDLVLLDIQMPIMNGEEVIKEIRAKEIETSRHQPVIALTAYSLRGDKERFMEMGFDGYLSKPLETRRLINEVQRVISMQNLPVHDVKG